MHYGTIPGIKMPVSRLAQGTATFFDPSDQASCFEMMDLATEFGINTFDTGHCYGKDKSVMFGRWLSERGMRDQVAILAKCSHPYGRNRVTPEDIRSDLNDTLEWMQVESVDMLVLHRDDPSVPVGPIVTALNELQKEGKIDAFGGSNWSHLRIQQANEYADQHGLTPFTISSPNFSLAEQVEEPWSDCLSISGPGGEAARQYYSETGLALFPWSSLAGGFFSDRFHRDNLEQLKEGSYFEKLCVKCYCYEPNFQRLDRARKMAQAKGLTVAQIALAFIMSQPLNIFGLVSCADRSQFEANTAALDVKLTPQERAYLDLRADTLASA